MSHNLKERIDRDAGLQKIRSRLNIVSLIFFGVIITGAEIQEANTFIFKVVFSNQDAMPWLLFVSISYLSFRYYTYARKYHLELGRKWIKRLERDKELLKVDVESNELYGLVVELEPKSVDLNYRFHMGENHDMKWDFHYYIKTPFVRYIKYYGGHVGDLVDHEYGVSLFRHIGVRRYLSLLFVELRYQVSSFIQDRERLDLFGPYILSALSMILFLYDVFWGLW